MDGKYFGEVFTPQAIATYMTRFIDNSKTCKVLEPCCGQGHLLRFIDNRHNITAIDINPEYVKYCKSAFPYCRVLLHDFIDFKTKGRFDYILANPPYIKVQNIGVASRKKIRNQYPGFLEGNTNMYVYFLLKCIDLLEDDGKLIVICPNSFLYNSCLQKFKDYLFENTLIEQLTDFKAHKIFHNASTYTCIMVISRYSKTFYKYSTSLGKALRKIPYRDGSLTSDSCLLHLFTPRIGLMTLCDEVYIIKDYVVQEDFIRFVKRGKVFTIEKESCKNILKVSTKERFKIIYPYKFHNAKVDINLDFQKDFPRCYNYLLEHQRLLHERDNGKGKLYKVWYQYGRSQALVPMSTPRLFLSTIVDNFKNRLQQTKADLYYSGFWLDSKIQLENLQKILFKYEKQILQNSNNKASGWHTLTQKSFNVPC